MPTRRKEADMNGMDVPRMKGAFRAYKMAMPAKVKFAREAKTIKTLEGNVQASKNDAIMTGINGEQWPISRAKFDSTYEPTGTTKAGEDGEYSKRKIIVYAVKMGIPFTVKVSGKGSSLHGKAGDYLVQYGQNDYGIVENSVFNASYTVI